MKQNVVIRKQTNNDTLELQKTNSKKNIPTWAEAEGSAFQAASVYQALNPPDIDNIFCVQDPCPDLSEIFSKENQRFLPRPRTSSGVWGKAPISHKIPKNIVHSDKLANVKRKYSQEEPTMSANKRKIDVLKKPYKCDSCGKEFNSNHKMQNHTVKRHGSSVQEKENNPIAQSQSLTATRECQPIDQTLPNGSHIRILFAKRL